MSKKEEEKKPNPKFRIVYEKDFVWDGHSVNALTGHYIKIPEGAEIPEGYLKAPKMKKEESIDPTAEQTRKAEIERIALKEYGVNIDRRRNLETLEKDLKKLEAEAKKKKG
jgi:hypothetical protein